MLPDDYFIIEDGVLKEYNGADSNVVIPDGVHTIGDGVFKGMAWLLGVQLPGTLRKIGDSSFKGCRRLKKLEFPKELEEIGAFAFHRCHDLEELFFPENMTKVGGYAFLYCDGLKKVIMEGPEHLEKGVFSHNLSLKEISVNENLDDSNFGEEVFEGCVRLEKITLSGRTYEVSNLIEAMDSHSEYPDIIKSIAKSAYHSLQIEDGVLQSFNINLKDVSLPEGITVIGKGCFFDKKGIVSIVLPGSLQRIRANAFLNCTSLKEVTVKNENLALDDKAFRGCCNLKKVNVSDNSWLLEEEIPDGLAGRIREQVLGDFYISGRILVRYLGDEEQITIPKEVEIIGERCFFGNERLKGVTCPENLKEIREQAFMGCVALQNVLLPEGLKRVEREAFAECRKLLKCNMPLSLKYIGEYAFRRCFTLPLFSPWLENTDISPYAFYRAKNFEGITEFNKANDDSDDSWDKPADADENDIRPYAFTKKSGIRKLELSGIKRIGKYAYASCPDLEEIIINAPECMIEQGAFSNCPNLKKVRLKIQGLGDKIFSYCRKLSEVFLTGVDSLPKGCFEGCYSLKKFEAKELRLMEARCFDECINLDSFDFTGIRKIGERAFERCDALKNVKLGKLLCGFHAFADCTSLESVEISEDTGLMSGAFIGCTGIKWIIYEDKRYEFHNFSDSLNHVGNPYPGAVREVMASIYSCFEIGDSKVLKGYRQDAVKITIPEDIEEVGQDVFRDHNRLREIDIPVSVKLFGSHAFSQTGWLEEERKKNGMVIVNNVLLDGALCRGRVEIPVSVARISSWCFAGNINIDQVIIPYERIIIEALSFRNCLNLKKITDWSGKEYVLTSVNDLTEAGYPELIQRIFSESINCFKLDESGNLTESTGNISELTFPLGIRSIGEGVYKDCHLLESVALSLDTEKIGRSAFENSKWLKTVKNAQAVKSLGAEAFSGCGTLEAIDFSDNLKEMGSRCFEHCCSLKDVYISKGLEKIPERAFFRCKSLTHLFIPESVKVIESEAFAFCDGLEEVTVFKGTRVSDDAFAYCTKLKRIKRI